ncbi:helix-turn-helix transcriptional regulator [Actinomadura sp. NPDC047616]|uniref:helix-turn-helix domain-containing protein n=1 Tax=Actinomadura sp. NPDC047616 TaxID=3155914 RepID=UPI0033D69175
MDATPGHQDFAHWLREQMVARGYRMDGLRAGGPSLLARQIGVHRATISRIFAAGAIPKPETLRLIADQLGIPRREVFLAAGVVTECELDVPEEPPTDAPDPSPDQVLPGGLRDANEATIWAMNLPWQARKAVIETLRREARRMLSREDTTASRSRRSA